MSQLFLTSASDYVMDDIVKKLPKSPAEYNVAFINTAAELSQNYDSKIDKFVKKIK